MPTCEYCGKEFTAKRRDARYCKSGCRAMATKKRQRAIKQAQKHTMTFEGRAMVEALRTVLPDTAERVQRFIDENGVKCAESAVKLVMQAIHEYQSIPY